jgi:hypothetical protein
VNRYRVTFAETIQHEWTVAAESESAIRDLIAADYDADAVSNVMIEDVTQQDSENQ